MNAVWLATMVGIVAFVTGAALGLVRERRHRRIASAAAARVATAEERARTSKDELRSMATALSSMQEGVVLFGADGGTTYANPAIERHLGSVPASVELLLPLEIRNAVRRAALAHLPTAAEAEIGVPTRWLRGSALPVGRDDSVLLVIADVTESKHVEAVRRDFVANASHELKTPVASIRAAAETIAGAAADDPDVIPAFAGRLERESIRLSRIVSDLLDLSRLEAGSESTSRVEFDRLVRDELERFDENARRAELRLSVETHSPIVVEGSRRDLALLVRNLVDNAIHYSRPGGKVHVATALDDEEAVLTVNDTGLGIPTRDIDRVFERFYRVDRARSRETGGTGLGLSIVKHVAENHGGTVSVRSELGRGSTFEVRLPAAPGA